MATSNSQARSGRGLHLRMSPKDLITVGVFAAIYIVIVFAVNMLGFVNPAVMIVALLAGIVAGGIPFLLFLTRVRHAGMVTIFAIVTGGLFLLTGHPPISFALTVGCALLAEAILLAGRYDVRRVGPLAYAAYSAWYAGPFLPLFYARSEYLAGAGVRQMGPEYAAQMDALLSPGVLIAFDACTVLAGLLGGLLGLRLLRRHFERAGLA